MKNYSSRKPNKNVIRFRTPSQYKANRAEYGPQRTDHLKGKLGMVRGKHR